MTFTSDPRRFLYRSDALQPEGALRLTADALANCDDGELYLQYTASESFGFDDGRLKNADFNTPAGFGLRGLAGRYLYDHLFEAPVWNRAIDIALDQALGNLESVAAPAGEHELVGHARH